jgi:FlaA1/EpsC-like NDP-sugar epimerase
VKGVPSDSADAWRWPTNENWVQSTLIWFAKVVQLGAAVASRWADRKDNRSALHTFGGMRNVLIVGADDLGRRIASYLDQHPENGRSVCGFLDDRKPLGNCVIGRTSDLAHLARAGFVDEVILAAPHDREMALRILAAAEGLRLDVKLAPDLFGCESAQRTEHVGGVPLISLHEEPLPVAGLLLKRALDVTGGGGSDLAGASAHPSGDPRQTGFARSCALFSTSRGSQRTTL